MTKQQVRCRICTKTMYTNFSDSDSETCDQSCAKELDWRKLLAAEGSPYKPRPRTRYIRIAELDPTKELDPLIEDLKSIPNLSIDRYLMQREAYVLFAANPPPVGPDFPIATLEGDWSRPSGKDNRVFGAQKVKALLRELRVSAFAVTRRLKKPVVMMPPAKEKVGING